jgi:hypothetical protein
LESRAFLAGLQAEDDGKRSQREGVYRFYTRGDRFHSAKVQGFKVPGRKVQGSKALRASPETARVAARKRESGALQHRRRHADELAA